MRFPFRWKLTLLVSVLSAAPVVLASVLLIDVNARAVERESRELQIVLANDLARSVDAELSGAERQLVAIGRVLSDPSLPADGRLALASALLEADRTLDHVAIYDADGTLIDVLRERTSEGVTPAERLAPELRAEGDGPVAAEVALAGGVPRVPVAAALRPDGTTTGYVATAVSLDSLQARVERLVDGHLAPLKGTIFVVDERGRLLAHPDAERAHALESVADEPILEGLDHEALGRAAPSRELVDGDGVPVVGTVVGLGDRPWAVVVQVPQSTAYASLEEMREIVIGSVAATVLVALVVAFFVSRRVTAPIAALSDFAGSLASRRFDRRAEVHTGDELETLADAMNRAAADLAESEEQIRAEAAIRADLGRYLPAELVDAVVRREQDMELGGRRTAVTVLFADVVAFTPLTDKLPAEEVVSLLNELFTVLTDVVFRHGGTVDKFVGDCVMAMWGAPTADPDHAVHALSAAEDMMRWLETANPGWKKRYGVTVQLAIGVNTGEVVVGNVGSERRMEYTAIGDVVNVAARLEAIARPQQILVTEATRAAAGDDFELDPAGERTLAGRAEPVTLWEVRV